MSKEPEKIIDAEESGSDNENDMIESENDMMDSEDEILSDMGDGLEDMGFDLASALVTEEGDTLCSALVDINNTAGEIAKQMATTNKILIKMLTKLS